MPQSHDDRPGAREQSRAPDAAGNSPAVGLPASDSVVAAMSLIPSAGMAGSPQAAASRTYQILRTIEVDEYEPAIGTPLARPAARAGDAFRGTARKAAKLSIADAPIEAFGDLPSLIASLPPDSRMSARQPPISDGADSARVREEMRTIRVRAFLYAASRENDNDFHLIIGSARDAGPLRCMTMELSGLPPSLSRSFARLKAARDAFKAFFGTNLPGPSYDFYDPPIPVEIEGSPFFDITHATGSRPGPASLRAFMPTIWEVHPISRIVFEP
jgi:hypothetical protein